MPIKGMTYASQTPDQQIPAQKCIGAERPVGDALEGDRDEQRDDDRIEDHRRQNGRGRRMEMHDVDRLEPRQGTGKKRRDDGKVFRHVIGDGEGRQRAPRHQELLADFHDFDQLGGVAVQIDHIGGFFGRLRAGVHGQGHVRLGQGRGIVRAVAHHGHQLSLGLLLPDVGELGLRCGLGEKVIDPRLLWRWSRR